MTLWILLYIEISRSNVRFRLDYVVQCTLFVLCSHSTSHFLPTFFLFLFASLRHSKLNRATGRRKSTEIQVGCFVNNSHESWWSAGMLFADIMAYAFVVGDASLLCVLVPECLAGDWRHCWQKRGTGKFRRRRNYLDRNGRVVGVSVRVAVCPIAKDKSKDDTVTHK